MNLMQNLMGRIQPIVGLKSWDYSVLWKLSDDQSFLEWMGCCCAGTENINNSNGDQEDPFPPCASALACRDVMLPHPRTKSCELLAQLPSSMPLDSGVHAQAFLSNQTRWLNFSHNSDSNISQEVIGTRVLIPAPGALIELFVAKQVPEDQQVIDFITAQCNITLEQQTMINSGGTMDSSYSINMNAVHEKPFLGAEGNYQRDHHNLLGPPDVVKEKPNLSYDISADRTPLCNSPMNFLQPFNYSMENGNKNSMFFEEAHELNPLKANSLENGFQEMDSALQNQMMGNVGNNMHTHMMEPFPNKEDQGYGDLYKQDNGRSNSNSESDINDDEDDTKCRRRTGKGHQAKNLVAERKRRKKLNDRLYNLRALVPKITKLDRASILGDAIEYVKELQKQVEDLKNELEGQSDDEGARSTGTNGNQNNIQPDFLLHQRGNSRGLPRTEHEKLPNACHKGPTGNGVSDPSCQNHESENANHKVQQMEPQVQVGQLEGNEFFVKVFCEHKPGGFVRLMEALNSLGLEVTNVNATRHTCLVSNIFKVEIRDSEIVQADLVRDSLLELTRNSYRGWPEVAAKPLSSGNGTDHNHHQMYQNPTPFSHS